MANGRLGPRGEGAFRRVLADMAMDHGVGVNAVADAAPLASVGRRRALGRRDGEQARSNTSGAGVELREEDLEALARLAEPRDLLAPPCRAARS